MRWKGQLSSFFEERAGDFQRGSILEREQKQCREEDTIRKSDFMAELQISIGILHGDTRIDEIKTRTVFQI